MPLDSNWTRIGLELDSTGLERTNFRMGTAKA